MTDPDKPGPMTELRARAEEKLRDGPADVPSLSPEESREALHELRVHQVELEMQNDELRIAQAEAQAARERYVDLYDCAPVGYFTLNERGTILGANLTAARLLGVDREGLATRPLSRFVLKEDQDTLYRCLHSALVSELVQSCEVRVRPVSEGEVFYARLELIRATEEGAAVCRLTLSDATLLKQAEQALREKDRRQLEHENAERMRLAFEAGDLGAWDQDFLAGRIVCTERASLMLGFIPGAAITWQQFLGRIHPEDRPAFVHAAERSTQPGGPGRFEEVFRLELPDGETRWIRFAAQSFFAPDPLGNAVRRTGVLADITREKEAEEVLKSQAKQLEILVRERTSQLQAAVGELEHFSYTLAHDLRAPLRAIRGYGGLVMNEAKDLSPTLRQFLERTSVAVERMDQLIVDALNYNKLVREKYVLAPVDSGTLLQGLLESYPQFQDAREHISIEGPMPRVIGNPALLTQCFANLLTNALKFVRPGTTPAVRIYAQEMSPRVRIWFEDHGIGIPEQSREKVFEMFQRLNVNYEGTGVGLALVRKAAQRMQGAVGVEPRDGGGSRFWVELHRAAGEREPGPAAKEGRRG